MSLKANEVVVSDSPKLFMSQLRQCWLDSNSELFPKKQSDLPSFYFQQTLSTNVTNMRKDRADRICSELWQLITFADRQWSFFTINTFCCCFKKNVWRLISM